MNEKHYAQMYAALARIKSISVGRETSVALRARLGPRRSERDNRICLRKPVAGSQGRASRRTVPEAQSRAVISEKRIS